MTTPLVKIGSATAPAVCSENREGSPSEGKNPNQHLVPATTGRKLPSLSFAPGTYSCPLFYHAAHPFGIVLEIDGCQTVEFFGLGKISLHKPRLGEVVVILAMAWIQINGPLKGSDGLIRLTGFDKESGMVC
jgi:hypothetical protein